MEYGTIGMVVRHHVREHRRESYRVSDYERGHGTKVSAFKGEYHGPLHGRLTYAERQKLQRNEFAIPSKRKYPIDTPNRARNALARVSANGTPKEKKQVCRAVHKHYPQIHAQYCPMHKDPVVVGERNFRTQEAAEAEADRLEQQGYKVKVRPTFGEGVKSLFQVITKRVRESE